MTSNTKRKKNKKKRRQALIVKNCKDIRMMTSKTYLKNHKIKKISQMSRFFSKNNKKNKKCKIKLRIKSQIKNRVNKNKKNK
jgi:hypothetical protein